MDPRLRRAMTLVARGLARERPGSEAKSGRRRTPRRGSRMPNSHSSCPRRRASSIHPHRLLDRPVEPGDDKGKGKLEMTEMHTADASRDLQLAAQLLELWRLCGKSRGRRGRA